MGVLGFWSLVGLLLSGAVPGAFASLVQDGRMSAIEIKAQLDWTRPSWLGLVLLAWFWFAQPRINNRGTLEMDYPKIGFFGWKSPSGLEDSLF